MSGRHEWASRVEVLLGDPVDPPTDTRREDGRVTGVQVRADRWDVDVANPDGRLGGFSILLGDLPSPRRSAPPVVGDDIVAYVHNGSLTVGFDLRGERLFLRSEREQTLRWLLFRARLARERAAA